MIFSSSVQTEKKLRVNHWYLTNTYSFCLEYSLEVDFSGSVLNMAPKTDQQETADQYWTLLIHDLKSNTTMASTARKKEEKRQLELSVYLDQVISDKVPEMEAKLDKNLSKVTAITKKIVNLAYQGNQYFNAVFADPKSVSDKDMITAKDGNTFDCRVFLKGFDQPDSFTTVSGLTNDIPPGYALYRLNDRFTRGEKLAVRTAWREIMDEQDHIVPSRIYPLFAQAMLDALDAIKFVEKREGKETVMRNVLLMNNDPSVVLQVMPEKNDSKKKKEKQKDEKVEEEEPLVVNMIICIKGYGWPNGVSLQQPMPRQKPYCEQGKKTMDAILDDMGDGQSMWFLEAKPVSLGKTMQSHPKCHANVTRFPEKSARLWKLCFTPTEDHFMQGVREFRNGSCAPDNVITILQLVMAHSTNPENWKALNYNVIRNLVFWMFKKHAPKIKSIPECFFLLLGLLKQTCQSMSCPHFLLPNMNIMESMDQGMATAISKEIETMLDGLEKDTSNLLVYTGIKKRDDDYSEDEMEEGDENVEEN